MRNIFIVNATQVVTSESHPEGLYSVMSGYPKNYDSRTFPAADARSTALSCVRKTPGLDRR